MSGPEDSVPQEQAPDEGPRIYVGSLSDYNHGILHGVWIDATQDLEDVQEQVSAMLAASPATKRYGDIAEEWAIHDYEGWQGLPLGEWEPLDQLVVLAKGIAEHGEALALWWEQEPRSDEDWADVSTQFKQQYQGRWDSVEEYAEQLLEDIGIDVDDLGPENLRPYIRFDLEAFARDLAGEMGVVEGRGGVYVFET